MGSLTEIPDQDQQLADAFYAKNGPCCSGCDSWHRINVLVGECHKTAPVAGHERFAMLGMRPSIPLDAGHIMTKRDHHCGEFSDTFDWSTLPAWYLRKIGRVAEGGGT